jgi:ElaB/YqjD/DUF883 family membrane-anchored ribosome-binding protein
LSPHSSFQDELESINNDLRSSLKRLETLLARTRTELAGAGKKSDREHLETVIRELERKLQEIRDIGLSGV